MNTLLCINSFSDAHADPWTDDLAGGILFQDDPYPANSSPYTDRIQAQDRFVNMTYRSPSVIQESITNPGSRRPMHISRPGGLIRGRYVIFIVQNFITIIFNQSIIIIE